MAKRQDTIAANVAHDRTLQDLAALTLAALTDAALPLAEKVGSNDFFPPSKDANYEMLCLVSHRKQEPAAGVRLGVSGFRGELETSDGQIAGYFGLIDVGSQVLVDKSAALHYENAVSDIQRETQYLLGNENREISQFLDLV